MDDQRRTVRVERYFPNVLAPAKEFKTLAQMEDDEFAALWNEAWQWFLNTFVNYIDVAGAERWEEMLGIIVPPGSTLADRRAAILLRINTQLPYTLPRLQEMLNAMYGDDMVIASTNTQYELWLNIDNRVILQTNALRIMLQSIIPANLVIRMLQEMIGRGDVFVGGMVSMVNTIYIQPNNDFTLDDFNIAAASGGMVSMRNDIFIKSEAV